jgi:hypothetical protein
MCLHVTVDMLMHSCDNLVILNFNFEEIEGHEERDQGTAGQ